MIHKNIGDYKVYCQSCGKKNSWEQYFSNKSANDYHCECFNCGGKAIPVDKNMIRPLLNLWKKGYETSFCCGGHLEKESGLNLFPYLGIKNKIEDCPHNWKIDASNDVFYLRPPFDIPLTNFNISNLNKDLIYWTKNLKNIPPPTNVRSIIEKGIKTKVNLHIFLGKHTSKAKVEFRNHYVLKRGKLTLDLMRKYGKIIVKNPQQLNELDFSSLNLRPNESLVVMFAMSPEIHKYNVPVSGLGWGSFLNPAENYNNIFLSLLKFQPTLWTHDKHLVYKIPYKF